MNRECDVVLRLVLTRQRQGKGIDVRQLMHLIDLHHWEDFVNQHEITGKCVSSLMAEGYLVYKDVQEPNGHIWKSYHVTLQGEEYLTSGNFT